MSRRELAIVLLLVAVGLLAFLALFERVEETVPTPPRGEAARNDTLAFERLVELMGIPVAGERELEGMPADDGALLLLAERSTLSPGQIDDLFEWVEGGGLLIVPAAIPWEGVEFSDDIDDSGPAEEIDAEGSEQFEESSDEDSASENSEDLSLHETELSGGLGEDEEFEIEQEILRSVQERNQLLLDRQRRPIDGDGAPTPIDPTWAVSLHDDPLLAPFGMAWGPEVWWHFTTTEAESTGGLPSGRRFTTRSYIMPRLEVLPAIREQDPSPDTATTSLDQRLERARLSRQTDAGPTSNYPLPVHGHVSDRLGALAIWAHLGRGTLVALYDPDFLFNEWIGEEQNAQLAWHLLRDAPNWIPPQQQPSELRVVRSISFPTLTELALDRGGLSVLSGLALLFLWLWRASCRTSPLRRAPQNRAERNLAQHLRASARFLHRQKLLEILLAALQRRAERAADHAQPGLEQLTGPARLEGLARRAGLPRSQVARALASEIVEEPAEFTRRVATLQHLYRGAPVRDRPLDFENRSAETPS